MDATFHEIYHTFSHLRSGARFEPQILDFIDIPNESQPEPIHPIPQDTSQTILSFEHVYSRRGPHNQTTNLTPPSPDTLNHTRGTQDSDSSNTDELDDIPSLEKRR